MKSISLIIVEETSPSEVLQKLTAFDFSRLNVTILLLSHDTQTEESKGQWQHDETIHFHILPLPDDEFYLKDLLQFNKSENICFFNPNLDYPTDYFQRTINRQESMVEDQPVKRIGSLSERILKAAQQSKYGLGIIKKDIKRDFSKLYLSNIYKTTDLKSGHILEKSIDEDLALEVHKWVVKNKKNAISYHPDYTNIEYFTDLNSYISGIKKEAPFLKFKENKEANGLPLYLLIFVWLSLVLAFFFPIGILIFMVFVATYFLAISLEAMSISTLKRQGELFIGLLFFLPFLHHIYLLSYFSSLIIGKKTD